MKAKNFFMVSDRIFSLGLKPRDFVVYCSLLKHRDRKKQTCFPSRKTIANECRMDRKTVDSAIKALESKGLVKKVYHHRADGTMTNKVCCQSSKLLKKQKPEGILPPGHIPPTCSPLRISRKAGKFLFISAVFSVSFVHFESL